MNSALQLYAVLLLLSDLRYIFSNLEALHTYRPQNIVLGQVNFLMSQHVMKRPSQARKCHAAVRLWGPCSAEQTLSGLASPYLVDDCNLAMTFADYVQLSPSRVWYQAQGQGSLIDCSQSPAHESGTFCLCAASGRRLRTVQKAAKNTLV